MGIFSVLFCIYVLIISAQYMDIASWLLVGGYYILGMGFWGYAKFMRQKDPSNWEPITLSAEVMETVMGAGWWGREDSGMGGRHYYAR